MTKKFRAAIYILWLPVWILILALTNRTLYAEHDLLVQLFLWMTIVWLGFAIYELRHHYKNPELWLAAFSVIFGIFMIEIAFRFLPIPTLDLYRDLAKVSDQDLWRFEQSHYAGYTSNPNWISEDGLDQVNSYGYRGIEPSVPKPENVFRVVALGGSTTYGAGVNEWQQAYPAQLEEQLQEAYGLSSIEVINGGQLGYDSFQTLMNLQFRALDLEPDLLIFYQNTNDVHARFVLPEAYRGDNSARRIPWSFEQQRAVESFPAQFPSLIWHLVNSTTGLVHIPTSVEEFVNQPCTGHVASEACLGAPLGDILEQNPPIYYQRNIESIVAIAQMHDVDIVFVTWAYNPNLDDYASTSLYQQGFDEHNVLLEEIAIELDVPLFDLASVMPTDDMYWSDGRHMSAEGNALRAELLAEFLVENDLVP